MGELTFQDKLLFVYTVATVVQVIVIVLSLVFIYQQARAARVSVSRLEETMRLSTYMDHRRDLFEVNRLLLEHPELMKLVNYEKTEIMAFILIGHAETMFRQQHDSLVHDEVRMSQQRIMRKFFKMPFVAKLWDEVKQEYTMDFVSFVESMREGATPTLRSSVVVAG